MAALAAMLIFTGSRLASPNEFLKVYKAGREQLFIFVFTMLMVLATDLLVGILLGVIAKLVIHTANGVPLSSMLRPFLDVQHLEDGSCIVFASRSAVFTNWIPFRRQIEHLGFVQRSNVTVDLSGTTFVDHTVMEKLHELQQEFSMEGLRLEIAGLENHQQVGGSTKAVRKPIGLPMMHRLTFTVPEHLESTIETLLSQSEPKNLVKNGWKSAVPKYDGTTWVRIELLIARDQSQRMVDLVRREMPQLSGMTMLIDSVGVLQCEPDGSNG